MIKKISVIITVLLVISSPNVIAQTGPGGIGTADGTTSLKFWIRPDNGITTTGSLVDSWTNSAGISALDISESGTQRPTLAGSALNGYDEVSYNGSNRLRTGLTLTTTNYVNDEASSFVVCRADNTSQTSCVYTTDPLVGSTRFSCHIPWSNTVYYDIGSCCGTDARIQVGGLSNLTSYSIWSYDASSTNGKQLYRNGNLLQDRANTSTYTSHASQRLNVGGNTSGTGGYVGDVAEIIIYNAPINTAERIIVQNYLSAKYDIALVSDDLYTMDDVANGNYDHDVAGIGREDASNLHTVSQGTGIVQISKSGGGLGDGEYLFWGHDNGFLGSFGYYDVPSGVQARLGRSWRVSEVGEPGSVEIAFDLTGLGSVTASELRLLIDSDGDGDFTDAVAISGATNIGGNYYEFSTGTDNALEDTYTFTIATTNVSSTPLPIELLYFDATVMNDNVQLRWSTASEINNDHFTIERSQDAENWSELTRVKGAGNSTRTLEYQSKDGKPLFGTSYYRLKQTDFNGAFSYSDIAAIEISTNLNHLLLRFYPNPSTGRLFISMVNKKDSHLKFKLFDTRGKLVKMIPHDAHAGSELIDLDLSDVASGNYLLEITDGLSYSEHINVVLTRTD